MAFLTGRRDAVNSERNADRRRKNLSGRRLNAEPRLAEHRQADIEQNTEPILAGNSEQKLAGNGTEFYKEIK